MDFDPYGNVLACCANVLFPLGNVLTSSLHDIWTGDRAERLRDALARGDLGYGCGNCRNRLLYDGGEIARDIYDHYVEEPPGVVGYPNYLGFSLHNSCNLACIMCGADLSSRIRSQRSDLPRMPHVYGDTFFDELIPFISNCKVADFRGGEPFLIPEHYRVWQMLAELNPRATCVISTNGMVWNAHVEQVLEQLSTSVVLSYDGVTPETFEGIRSGSNLATVHRNLERFHQYCEARGTDFQLSFSLVRQNWHELGAVLLFAENLGVDCSVQTVLEPEFGVQRLPTKDLEVVVRALEAEGESLTQNLHRNRAVWVRELARLIAELEMRRSTDIRPLVGEPPHPDNADHAARLIMSLVSAQNQPSPWKRHAPRRRRDLVEEVRRELAMWSDDGKIDELVVSEAGVIVDASANGALGGLLPHPLIGLNLTSFFGELEVASGQRLWISEEFVGPGRVEQLLRLGPVARDRLGPILRLISTPESTTQVRVAIAIDINLTVVPGVETPAPVPVRRSSIPRHSDR